MAVSGKLVYKVILLGELGVGKTSLFRRLRDNVYEETIAVASGIDCCFKKFEVDGEQIKLNIWDTAGVERFRTLTKNYYRGAHAAIFVYALDDPSSIQYLSQWVRDANDYADEATRIMIGTKLDTAVLVDTDTVKNFAATHCIDHMFTISAKTGEGVEDCFVEISRLLRAPSKDTQRLMAYMHNVDLNEGVSPNEKKLFGCCS
ncbi:ras-related protein Rab-1B-like [Saccoglossus kowalevskii]|uniref:Ras-related protein Rab-35-like n=1 Tax=Saccoglossus kowalevskii TaxID=10224 RepID=A0ABM0GVH7_SACKO|nr:PREDICTED: ras-related protein Rab-35-like [Saccoglossus kowalevskii]